jgi:hypothetical protein
MTDSFYVGGYWGPRAESMEECADRLELFMRALADIDPALATWFEPARSRKMALESKIEPRSEQLWDLLLEGRYFGDEREALMPQLGFRTDLWNGQDSEIGLSVHCGSWSSNGRSNNALIDLPRPGDPGADKLYRPQVALALVRTIVTAWSPSDVTWVGRNLREAQDFQVPELVVGWATYLSAERVARSGKMPDDVQVEACGDGLIITIGDDPTDVPLETVMAVRKALGPALLPDPSS